jgi:PEP-CTERM motif
MKKLPLKGKLLFSLLAFVVVTLAASTTARADIVITQSVDNTGTENVLFDQNLLNLNVIVGNVNSGLFAVNFTSTGGTLSSAASGQARVLAGSNNSPFDQISFELQGGHTFTNAVFNLNAATTGQIEILVEGVNINGGTFAQVFVVDMNGENFFTVHAVNGQAMTKISLTGITNINGPGATFEDLRQVRIGGFNVPSEIPEPATMLLFGTGLIGAAAGIRRRFRKS